MISSVLVPVNILLWFFQMVKRQAVEDIIITHKVNWYWILPRKELFFWNKECEWWQKTGWTQSRKRGAHINCEGTLKIRTHHKSFITFWNCGTTKRWRLEPLSWLCQKEQHFYDQDVIFARNQNKCEAILDSRYLFYIGVLFTKKLLK